MTTRARAVVAVGMPVGLPAARWPEWGPALDSTVGTQR